MILTPDQRLRVFVSSTLAELAPERLAVREVIEAMRLAPVMFELGARPHPPRALYRAYLEQSHVFVAIYGERYGWVAPTMDISGLEDEFRLSGDRPKLVYIKEPAPNREERLTAMLDDVATDERAVVRIFQSNEELATLLADDLAHLLAEPFAAPQPATPAAKPTHHGPTAATSSRLPTAPTRLIGRSRELQEVSTLLRRPDVRLVTLTGIGGIGKSRLAVDVAHECAESFEGGVTLTDLANVPETGLVLTSIAAALGVNVDIRKPMLDVVAETLSGRGETLLILDNAEHVLEAAEVIAALVNACPSVTFLVTSRKRLRLAAEHDYPLTPLSVGPGMETAAFGWTDLDPKAVMRQAEESEALQLFVDRAHAARPDLDLMGDPEQLRAAIIVCQRLDGIPLAIELAAARVRLLPPTQLLKRFDRPLDMPSARLADLPERQRTLRATLDWSLELLDEPQRDLLAQLSTFAGGASLDAVQQVCRYEGDLLDALATLADQSLVEVELSVVDAPRFRLLSTVREFARDLLEESGRADEVDAAHVAWMRDLAQRAREALPGVGFSEWVDRLEMESANIRQAGSRAFAAGDPESLATVGFSVWIWLWAKHHTREARLWLERALDHPNLQDPLLRARIHWTMAGAAIEQGDAEDLMLHLGKAKEMFTELDNAEGLALCLWVQASAVSGEDQELGAKLFLEAEQLSLAVGLVFTASICSSVAGMMLAAGGRVDEAEACLARGLKQAESIDNSMLRAQATTVRGMTRLAQGRIDDAAADLVAGADFAYAAGNPEILCFAIEALAAVQLGRNAVDEKGVMLVAAAQGIRERAGIVPWPLIRPYSEMIAAGVKAAASPEMYDDASARGRHLEPDAIVEITRTFAAPSN